MQTGTVNAPVGGQVLPSGVRHLDTVLGGGIPARSSLLLTGLPGTGKSALGGQLAFAQAARGTQVVIATTSAEPHSKLLEALQSFSFFSKESLARELFLVSAQPWVKKGAKDAREMLLSIVRERRARLLLVDGLSGIDDQWRDPYLLNEFLTELGVGLLNNDCSAVFTLDAEPQQVMQRPYAAAVDGIVALGVERRGMERSRRLEVLKLRGRRPLLGEHSFQLDSDGIRVSPRLETVAPFSTRAVRTDVRAGFGLSRLDTLLGGGVPAESAVLLTGPAGTGKTLLAAAFIDDAVKRDEASVMVSFHESPTSLARRTAAVSIPLAAHIEAGKTRVLHPNRADLDPDDFAHHLLTVVHQVSARRVVIDGMEELERKLWLEDRKRDFFAALSNALRAAGATVLLTLEGPTSLEDLDGRGLPLTSIAENVIALEYVRHAGQRIPTLSVLKMNASAHDKRVFQYQIGDRGIELGPPLAPYSAFDPRQLGGTTEIGAQP